MKFFKQYFRKILMWLIDDENLSIKREFSKVITKRLENIA